MFFSVSCSGVTDIQFLSGLTSPIICTSLFVHFSFMNSPWWRDFFLHIIEWKSLQCLPYLLYFTGKVVFDQLLTCILGNHMITFYTLVKFAIFLFLVIDFVLLGCCLWWPNFPTVHVWLLWVFKKLLYVFISFSLCITLYRVKKYWFNFVVRFPGQRWRQFVCHLEYFFCKKINK